MTTYVVMTDVLDRIDRTQDPVFDRNDLPRKVVKHQKGDAVEFHEDDQEQVDNLLRLGSIKKEEDVKKEQEAASAEESAEKSTESKEGGASPPAGQTPGGKPQGQ